MVDQRTSVTVVTIPQQRNFGNDTMKMAFIIIWANNRVPKSADDNDGRFQMDPRRFGGHPNTGLLGHIVCQSVQHPQGLG